MQTSILRACQSSKSSHNPGWRRGTREVSEQCNNKLWCITLWLNDCARQRQSMAINGKGKIRLPLHPKPLKRWSLKLAWVIKSGTHTPVQNFLTIRSGVFAHRERVRSLQSDSASFLGVLFLAVATPYSQAPCTDFYDQYVIWRRCAQGILIDQET